MNTLELFQFFKILWGVGVLIIPKWRIKVPVHIAILFGSRLELSKITKSGSFHPFLITKIFEKIHEIMRTSLKMIEALEKPYWSPTGHSALLEPYWLPLTGHLLVNPGSMFDQDCYRKS